MRTPKKGRRTGEHDNAENVAVGHLLVEPISDVEGGHAVRVAVDLPDRDARQDKDQHRQRRNRQHLGEELAEETLVSTGKGGRGAGRGGESRGTHQNGAFAFPRHARGHPRISIIPINTTHHHHQVHHPRSPPPHAVTVARRTSKITLSVLATLSSSKVKIRPQKRRKMTPAIDSD